MNTTSRTLITAWLCALALASCKSTSDSNGADGGNALATAGTTAGSAGTAASDAGGSSGDSGTAANSGSSGSAGSDPTHDAGVDSLDDGGAAPCAPCIGDTIGWGPNGGLVAYADHSELTQCNAYHHTRTPSGRAPSDKVLECEREVPCMGSGLHGIADVLRALGQPDVVAARTHAMLLYGTDPRPVDGTVLRIELPGSIIEVGGPCATSSGPCTAIPAGIGELVSLLQSIDAEQLGIEPCFSTFQ